jgi:DeoR/GlpR family transcriptional regulator of sugar metabolism
MKPTTRRGQQTRRLVKVIYAFQVEPTQSLNALSQLTGYSTRTIRRDLYAMETEGICSRSKVGGKLFWKLRDTLGHTANSGS